MAFPLIEKLVLFEAATRGQPVICPHTAWEYAFESMGGQVFFHRLACWTHWKRQITMTGQLQYRLQPAGRETG